MEMAENQPSKGRVGTVRLTNLLAEHNEVNLKEMFAKFGEVKIIMDKNSSSAFVTFQDFDTAVIAIESQSSFRVGINFAFAEKETDYFPIQSLNNDCLLHIISFLSVEDKLNLSETSQRFLSLCGISFRISNKPLLNYGDGLRVIDGYFSSGDKKIDMRALKFVPKLCANLKALELSSRKSRKYAFFSMTEIKRIITNSPNLESVSIWNMYLCGTILDELSKLKNFEMLTLYNSRNDISRNLIKLKNLTELNLTKTSFKSTFYIELFEKVKLERLILLYAYISIPAFEALLAFQTTLQKLVIDAKYDCKYLDKLPNLPNLKELYLVRIGGVNVSLVDEIFFNQSKNKDLKIFISGICDKNFDRVELKNNMYPYYGNDGRIYQIYTKKCNVVMCDRPYLPPDLYEVINITAE